MPSADDLHRALTDTAASYLHLGWSVVPLWGDTRPEQAKVPAVAWAPYQRRRASEQDAARWFTGTPYRGLGIVTGALSQLVVLDFDDLALADRFATHYPELTATRTVHTRRGQHLYFRTPAYLRLPSRKLTRVDLLSDGCYVVAPPTTIDGHTYTVERGGLPKLLTPDDLIALNTFLDQHSRQRVTSFYNVSLSGSNGDSAPRVEKSQPRAFTRPQEAAPVVLASDNACLMADGLTALYHGMAATAPRNVALFKAACLARDRGWKHEAVMAVLAPAHVQQPARGLHRREKPQARSREAERTIRSAFSKPPRPPQPQDKDGLFNSIREKLVQLGQTCVVRVLEGLRLAGLKAGQLVTERELVTALKSIVGRYSIRKTLAATTATGKALFEQVRAPRYPPRSNAASHRHKHRQKNAFVTRAKPDSIRGRPENRYRIPTVQRLCRLLDVTASGSDPMTRDDLRSAQQTRQALHRGLIARRPGTYLRKWLADRIGVSETTIWRYGKQITGLNSVPTFTQTPLGWANLNAIPRPDAAPPGTCLEDSTGKRWPAVKGIAQKLLGQGRGVRLLVRSLNYYWVGQSDPPFDGRYQVQRALDVTPERVTVEPVVTLAQQVARLVRTIGEPAATLPAAVSAPAPPPTAAPCASAHSSQAPPRKRKRAYWKPLADPALERLASEAFRLINQQTVNAAEKLSMVSARTWADTYGEQRLRQALDVLSQRQNIVKPAGFVATLLRTLNAK